MQCSACKADLATNIEYCPYCGQKISPQNGTTIFKKALDITTISCPYCKINLASGKCPMCNWSSVSGIPAPPPPPSTKKQKRGTRLWKVVLLIIVIESVTITSIFMYPRIINYGRTRIPVKKVITSPTQTVVPSPTPSTPEGLLAQLTSGDPILTDPLDGSSKEQWKLFSSAQGTCKFENGTYHVIANNANNTSATQSACWNQSTSFHKDIILQAQYKLDKGDTAEFLLRAGESKTLWGMYALSPYITSTTVTPQRDGMIASIQLLI